MNASIVKIVPVGLLERRFARLRERVLDSRRPIVWLRAIPGAGKSRFLSTFRDDGKAASPADWRVIDGESPGAVQAALSAAGALNGRPQRRVIVASHASEEYSRVLLTPNAYGLVEVVDDAAFFLTAADILDAEGLFAATGGWPMLVDAWLAGRGEEIQRVLPDFLELEVLPHLPQSLVSALFGAVGGPLAPAAIEYLFGRDAALHPLLRGTDAGTFIAGDWVRAALEALRARSGLLPRSVRDDLTHLAIAFGDPTASVVSLIEIGHAEQAIEIFERAGGMFFGYLHGFQALQDVLRAFGPDWERRTETLFLAHLCLLNKNGQFREARLRLESKYPGLPVDLRDLAQVASPYAMLMRLDISLDNDETLPLEVITSWSRLEGLLPPEDHLARGILYNSMAIGFLQSGALFRAQQLSEEALLAYQRAGSPYLAHYMLLHLCDLALRHDSLADASDKLRRAEEALRVSALAFNSEPAIIEAFRVRIAYEEGRFADCPLDVDGVLQALLRGDSWQDLISAMAGHAVFTAFWRQGLRAALDQLEYCSLTLTRRHGPSQHSGLLLVQVRLYQIARRYVEAGAILEKYDAAPASRRRPHHEMEERLIRLRQHVVQERLPEGPLQAANVLAQSQDLAPRQKISIGILQAYLRHRAGEEGPARRHLRVALHQAEAGNLLGVLVEEGQFLEYLLPGLIADSAAVHAPLKPFARRVLKLLGSSPTAAMRAKTLAGISRQEHRVLGCLADGHTNKEIARALKVTEATVKFHLGNLFRKLQVRSRARLLDAARKRALIP
jgi:DNA-binding CsgD family transcriptional regulator